MIVLLTEKSDWHADWVLKELISYGEAVIRLHTSELSDDSNITFISKSKSGLKVDSKSTLRNFDTSTVKSILIRRPEAPVAPCTLRDDPNNGWFSQQEWGVIYRSIYSLPDPRNTLWINDPYESIRANNKLYQARIAREHGWSLPSMIVTNNPLDAWEFYREYKARGVICKPLGVYSDLNRSRWAYAQLLPNDLTEADFLGVTLAPTQFQEFIEKSYDLRITFVGDEIFACGIASQENSETRTDFRRVNPNYLRHWIVDLQQDLINEIREIQHVFRLEAGEIDYAIDGSGNRYFLEVNPNGQWLWVELKTGLPISRAFASLLSAGTSTLS